LETLPPIHIDILANVFAQRKRSLVLDAILKGELERALHELSRTGPEASEQLLTRLRSGEVIGHSDKDCGTLNKKGFVPFGEKEFPADRGAEMFETLSRLKGEEALQFGGQRCMNFDFLH